MADVFTKRKRSEVMARIRGRGNKDTELALARLFRVQGITGWRRQMEIRGRSRREEAHSSRRRSVSDSSPRLLRVKADFVFRQERLAVFVDGCFWHGCPLHGTKPKINAAFWKKKLTANKRRDALVNRTLRKSGWRVVRIWEHALQRANRKRLLARLARLVR